MSRSRERSSAPTASRSRGRSCRRSRSWSARRSITTGPEGDFEFTAERILIDHFAMRVEAPGLASKMFTLKATGEVPAPLKLGVGAVVTGRVLRDGKPVAGVAMGLQQMNRGMDEYLGELKAKTDEQGRFRFDHAFADQELSAYAVTGSLKDNGAITPRVFRTVADGSTVDLGDFEVKRGRRLAGRVVFSDGKAIPARTTVLASSEHASGLVRVKVDAQGRFELVGLPESEVGVSVRFPDIDTWLPPGYRLSARNKCLDPLNRSARRQARPRCRQPDHPLRARRRAFVDPRPRSPR